MARGKTMNAFLRFLEVKKDVLSQIGSRINLFSKKEIEEEPFNNIFGNESRIVIPISSNEEQEFIKVLNDLGLNNVNLKTGIGERETQTQQRMKKQTIKIGKFLEKAGSKEALSWWAKNKDKIGRDDVGVSVIISRHPIDIVRMSDHDEFKSCHSPGGSWFQCAIQEAKRGGAVAYVVKNADLKKIKNLQAKDIFKDKDRNIEGIEPLERVRLRRFNDGKSDYLVPELRTYGIKHVGLLNTVKSWAKNIQKLDNVDIKNLELVGGTYQDNSSTSLWSNLLDKQVNVKNKVKNSKELTQDRVDEIVDAHNYKHFNINAELMNIDGDPYVDFNADVYYQYQGKLIERVNVNEFLKTIKK